MSGRQQYRVTWRRRDWAPTTWPKSRTFPSEGAALRFADQLHDDWPDAAPVEEVTIDVREVTPWRPYEQRQR